MKSMLMALGILAVSACSVPLSFVPINIIVDFPEEELEGALERMESEVQSEKKAPEKPDLHQNMLRRRLPVAWVRYVEQDKKDDDIDIDVSTPQIKDLTKKRTDRFEKLKPQFQAGRLGEKNDGLLDIRSDDGQDAKEKGALKKLKEEENTDRTALFKEIARANGIPEDRIGKVKKVFAKVRRKKAETGWMIQDEDGTWKKKEEEK